MGTEPLIIRHARSNDVPRILELSIEGAVGPLDEAPTDDPIYRDAFARIEAKRLGCARVQPTTNKKRLRREP